MASLALLCDSVSEGVNRCLIETVGACDGREGMARRDLLSSFEIFDEGFEFSLLFGAKTGEFKTKGVAVDPTDGCLVNPQRPIEARHVESALKRGPLFDNSIALNSAPANRHVERATLTFIAGSAESASELCGEAGLYAPLAPLGL